jgi:hypothetical protein
VSISDLRLIITDLIPRYPAQHAFWPRRARRLAAAHELADVLARRYGKPLLFRRALDAPDAIFDQDRSRLVPLAGDATPAVGSAADASRGSGDASRADGAGEIPHGIHWW